MGEFSIFHWIIDCHLILWLQVTEYLGCSHNLPSINQRRQVETDDVHLQFDSVIVLDNGANGGVLYFAVVKGLRRFYRRPRIRTLVP